MNIPYWLLRLLPIWDHICPKCKREVKQKSHKCPYCNEDYGVPLRVPPKVLKDLKALEDYVHSHVFPRVSASQREYLAQFFTIIFSDGFESDFIPWTGTSGTPQIVNSRVHHGTKAALFNPQGAAEYAYKTLSSSQAVVYHRFYMRTSEMPNADTENYDISRGYVGANAIWQVAIAYSAAVGGLCWQLNYRSGATWTGVYSALATILTNTWYCVEFYWKLGAADGEAHLYINGVDVVSVAGKDTDNYGNCDTIRNGVSAYSGTFTGPNVVEDCVVVADAYIGLEPEPSARCIVVTPMDLM